MTGKKAPKVSGNLRRTFAENVKQMMEVAYPLSRNKPMSLARAAGISLSSVQRATSGETAPNLDTVEAIATALRITAYQLMIEHGPEGIVQRPPKRTGTNN